MRANAGIVAALAGTIARARGATMLGSLYGAPPPRSARRAEVASGPRAQGEPGAIKTEELWNGLR
jgi:hypothetical protein